MKNKLPELLKGYNPDDIYNTDDTSLYYKCLPDKTFAFKDEKCFGVKFSKQRITLYAVMVGTKMSGSDKLDARATCNWRKSKDTMF